MYILPVERPNGSCSSLALFSVERGVPETQKRLNHLSVGCLGNTVTLSLAQAKSHATPRLPNSIPSKPLMRTDVNQQENLPGLESHQTLGI